MGPVTPVVSGTPTITLRHTETVMCVCHHWPVFPLTIRKIIAIYGSEWVVSPM